LSRRVRLLALALVLASPLAQADDCDLLDPAPGTGATQIAQTFDACVADPVNCKPAVAPPSRERHGFLAGGDATLGTLNQAQSDGEVLSAGELAAKGRVGWRSGPQACGSTDLIAGTQTRGDTAFHVVFPWPFFETGMLGFEQQWQLRPRLDASRIYLRRLYSSTQVQAGIAPVAWAHADGGNAAVLAFRVNDMQRDQDRTGATLETVRLSAYESNHPTSHLEVLPVTWTTMYPHGIGPTGGEASSEMARVDAVALTHRGGAVTIDAAGGGLFASRPIAVPLAGLLGVAWGPWSARVERDAFLAMDDSITIEDRITAGYHDGMWRAGAFAALTHTSADAKPQVTGGGSAGVDVDLPEELKLAVDVEVARSYYARLDGDPSPTPQLAGLGTVKLERHFNVNPTAH
jgi:hypothetical protein